jgi:hypothetical protein
MALAKLRGRYRDPSHTLASTHAYLPSLLTSSLRVCAYYNWWTHTALLYHPESEVHVRPSSLMFQQMHNGVYPSWQCCTALKIFCALIVSSSLLTPGISSIFFFYCLHNSVFSRMSWVGVTQYKAFSDWLFHLIMCIYISSMSFYGLVGRVLLVQNNTALSGCIIAYLFTCWRTSLLSPCFGD